MQSKPTTRARRSARQVAEQAEVIPLRPRGRTLALTAAILPAELVAQAIDRRLRVRAGIVGLRQVDRIITEIVLRGLEASETDGGRVEAGRRRRALSALIEGSMTAAAISAEANVTRELVRELERQGLVALDGVSRRGVHRRLKITAAGMRELGHVAPWEGGK